MIKKIDIRAIDLFLLDNPSIGKEIRCYIDSSLAKNEFYDLNEKEMPLVFFHHLVEKKDKKKALNDDVFNHVLYKHLLDKQNLNLANSYTNFEKQRLVLKQNYPLLRNNYTIWRGFERYFFIYYNQIKGWSFEKYITTFTQKNREYFDIQDSFSKALPQLRIHKKSLSNILNHLYNHSKEDMTFGEVYTSVIKYCENQESAGWGFLNYCINSKNKLFIASILMGLSKVRFEKTYKYTITMLNREGFEREAIIALGNFKYIKFSYLKSTLDVFESINTKETTILAALARAYGLLVYNDVIKNSNTINFLFKKLEKLANTNMPEIQSEILTNVFRFTNRSYINEKTKLILCFTHLDEKYSGMIDRLTHILAHLEQPNIVLGFLKQWSINHTINADENVFRYPLTESFTKHPDEYISIYLSLLIDNSGLVRYYATRYLKVIPLTIKNVEIIKKQLGNLTEANVKKLANSLVSIIVEPQNMIKILLIIFKQHSKELYKFILQHLIWLTHDFGETVKSIVEEELNISKDHEKRLLIEYKKYYALIINSWKEKQKIKEFNPFYTQEPLFSDFNLMHIKVQSESLRKTVEKKSVLLQFFKKTPIGRGTAFKSYRNDQISQLSEISHSIQMPKTYFPFPEAYNLNQTQRALTDWNDSDD